MQSLKSMRALKLVVNGKTTGRVVQGQLSDDLRRLDGVWVDAGFKGMRFIDAEHICVIGSRSVVADEPGIRLRIRPQSLFIRAVSSDGALLGAIVDAWLDETTLAVVSLSLSTGYPDLPLRGLRTIADYRHDLKKGVVMIPCDQINQEVF